MHTNPTHINSRLKGTGKNNRENIFLNKNMSTSPTSHHSTLSHQNQSLPSIVLRQFQDPGLILIPCYTDPLQQNIWLGVGFPIFERRSRQDNNGKVACKALLSHENGEITEFLQEIDSLMTKPEITKIGDCAEKKSLGSNFY